LLLGVDEPIVARVVGVKPERAVEFAAAAARRTRSLDLAKVGTFFP